MDVYTVRVAASVLLSFTQHYQERQHVRLDLHQHLAPRALPGHLAYRPELSQASRTVLVTGGAQGIGLAVTDLAALASGSVESRSRDISRDR